MVSMIFFFKQTLKIAQQKRVAQHGLLVRVLLCSQEKESVGSREEQS